LLILSVCFIHHFYSFESLTLTIERSPELKESNELLSFLCAKFKKPGNCVVFESYERWEVFFDTGNGYNASEYLNVKFKEHDNIIKFELPPVPIKTFRIDPGTHPQIALIRKICIESSRQKVCWQPEDIAKNFVPLHDIGDFMATREGLCLQITGEDPFFSFKGQLNTLIDPDTGVKKYILYAIAIALSVGIFFFIPPVIRFFKNHPKYLEKIILSEKPDEQPTSIMQYISVLIIVFAYLSLWAFLKPPGQSPDEIAHLAKVFSIPQAPWFTPAGFFDMDKRIYNPVMDYPAIHFVPLHYDQKFTKKDYIAMKSLEWGHETGQRKVQTSAHSYPGLYYITIFLCSEFLKKTFSLSPFETFYAYRLITAWFAAMLWLWTYHALGLPAIKPYRKFLFWGIVLIPMLGFMSSSVNPDAFAFPLTALCMIYSYSAISEGKNMFGAISVFLLNLFVKPSALIIFPTLGLVTCGILLFRHDRKDIIRRFFMLTIPAFIISYMGFYHWSKPILYGRPVIIGLSGYIKQFFYKLPGFFVMYWGDLGWLDVVLDEHYYLKLRNIILFNLSCVLIGWRNFKEKAWASYFLVFALIYCAGVVAGEYHYLSIAGYTLQGRYLLPAALGLSVFAVHRFLPAIYVFMGYLVIFNIALVHESLYRYFGFDLTVFLPF
jgi:hypothetical protein